MYEGSEGQKRIVDPSSSYSPLPSFSANDLTSRSKGASPSSSCSHLVSLDTAVILSLVYDDSIVTDWA